MPIEWKDVKTGLDAARYTVRTGATILTKSKPWAQYLQSAKSLALAIRQITS